MRHRLYFMLPNVAAARGMLDTLLLARIEERHMHFYAKDGTLPDDMPEANFLQKTDIVHGAELGMLIGGCVGLFAGTLILLFPPEGIELRTMAILAAGFGGALFGMWASSMVAAAIPNSRLTPFLGEIERGGVLLIIDVPLNKVKQIQELIQGKSGATTFAGEDPHVPVFP